MNAVPFSVRTTSAFDRQLKKLVKQHRDLIAHFGNAITVLSVDPYNRSRSHDVKKLEEVCAGEGQFRLRLGRYRFRYDVAGRVVTLMACSLRREDTYA